MSEESVEFWGEGRCVVCDVENEFFGGWVGGVMWSEIR